MIMHFYYSFHSYRHACTSTYIRICEEKRDVFQNVLFQPIIVIEKQSLFYVAATKIVIKTIEMFFSISTCIFNDKEILAVQ